MLEFCAIARALKLAPAALLDQINERLPAEIVI